MKKLLVLYDSWCPMCIKVKSNIEKLDWLHVIQFQTIRKDTDYLDIPSEKLSKQMHCIDLRNNKIHAGIDAIAEICFRIPFLFMFYIPIKISSYIKLGDFVYNHIANSRKIVPVNNCTEDVCKVPNYYISIKEKKQE